MAYDALGRLVRVEAMDGVTVTRDYDAVGNVLRQQVATPNYAATAGVRNLHPSL